MRRTPLLLAFLGSLVAMVAISSSVLASGKAVGLSKSAHASQTAQAATSKTSPGGAASSASTRGAQSHGNPPGTAGSDRDVKGNSMDPSAPKHDVDNGKGNACDPGWGGAINNNGNFARFPDNSGDTGSSNCSSSSASSSQTPPSPTPGFGGAVEAAHTTVPPTGGVLGATGVGGAVAGMSGVMLADTGLKSIVLGLVALLLLVLGFVLIRRRAAGTA